MSSKNGISIASFGKTWANLYGQRGEKITYMEFGEKMRAQHASIRSLPVPNSGKVFGLLWHHFRRTPKKPVLTDAILYAAAIQETVPSWTRYSSIEDPEQRKRYLDCGRSKREDRLAVKRKVEKQIAKLNEEFKLDAMDDVPLNINRRSTAVVPRQYPRTKYA